MTIEYFRRRKQEPVPGFTIGSILRKKETAGSVGIEIEVEGNKFPKVPGYETTHKAMKMEGMSFWSYVKDGSLRGADNAEYVLNNPIEFDAVPAAIAELEGKLKAYGSVLDDSNRTSVHVHLNCQQFHMNRLAAFCALYFCFEEVLTEWCGDHRIGNLFCLRGKDAPGIISKLKRFIQSDGTTELSEGLHYSGLNANALNKFGSLEVRTLRGPTDFGIIVQWVSILERLYTLSAEFIDPRDIPALFSQSGPMTFFETVLGDSGIVIRQGIDFDDERVRDSMYEGIRLAQDLCYCRDWTYFSPVDMKNDPFGRDIKKMSQQYLNAVGAAGGNGMVSYDIEAMEQMFVAQTAPSQGFSLSSFAQAYGSNQTMAVPVPAPQGSLVEDEPEDEDFYEEPDYDEDEE